MTDNSNPHKATPLNALINSPISSVCHYSLREPLSPGLVHEVSDAVSGRPRLPWTAHGPKPKASLQDQCVQVDSRHETKPSVKRFVSWLHFKMFCCVCLKLICIQITALRLSDDTSQQDATVLSVSPAHLHPQEMCRKS